MAITVHLWARRGAGACCTFWLAVLFAKVQILPRNPNQSWALVCVLLRQREAPMAPMAPMTPIHSLLPIRRKIPFMGQAAPRPLPFLPKRSKEVSFVYKRIRVSLMMLFVSEKPAWRRKLIVLEHELTEKQVKLWTGTRTMWVGYCMELRHIGFDHRRVDNVITFI